MTNASFSTFAIRCASCHMVTYFAAGIIAYTLLDYKAAFEQGPMACILRPMSSPWVAAGPGLQVFRGLLFAAVLYPFLPMLLATSGGTWKLWGLLAGLAVLGTAGPPPGSLEGVIYTKLPVAEHLRGLPETLFQTLGFSVLLIAWYRRPSRWWRAVPALACLVLLLSGAALIAPRPDAFR